MAEVVFDLVLDFFAFIGGVFHWLFFLGKKKFKEVMEKELINGIIGFVIFVLLLIVFRSYLKSAFLFLIHKLIQ